MKGCGKQFRIGKDELDNMPLITICGKTQLCPECSSKPKDKKENSYTRGKKALKELRRYRP